MRKLLSLVLVVVLICVSFAGCKPKEVVENPADKYPERAIEVVIPVAPGGGTDLSGRLTASYLEKVLGTNMAIINMGGAGGSIGMTDVVNSKADGYRILYHQSDVIANSVMGVVDYKWDEKLKVAGTVNSITNMALLVPGDAPYSTLDEFVKYANAQPKPLNIATEIGTDNQLFMMQFAKEAKIKLNVVDLGGASARVAAMKGKQIDVTCMPYFNVKDYIAKGDFKCIGIFNNERNKFFPNVPTIKEQGLDLSYSKFHLFAFPAETPNEIVDKFSKALEKVCSDPAYIKDVGDKLGFNVMYKNPADSLKFMKDIEAIYAPLAKK